MNDTQFLRLWLALNILGGQVAIPLLLITLYLSPLKRAATLYSLLWSLVVWSISELLLFYAGRAWPNTPEPGFSLCLAQSSLYHATLILGAWSTFALIYDTWSVVTHRDAAKSGEHASSTRTFFLILIPWLAFVCSLVGALLVGRRHAKGFNRQLHIAYCAYLHDPWSKVSSVLCGIAMIGSLVLTVRGLVWCCLKSGRPVSPSPSVSDAAMAMRVWLLGVTELAAAVISVLTLIGAVRNQVADLIITSLPFSAWLIFGSQKDVLYVYIAWAKSLHSYLFGHSAPSSEEPQYFSNNLPHSFSPTLSPPSSTPWRSYDVPEYSDMQTFYLFSLPRIDEDSHEESTTHGRRSDSLPSPTSIGETAAEDTKNYSSSLEGSNARKSTETWSADV
ncbi:hypothetical protein DL93DRAFT_2081771 [Clavulina sp. PMI_390]|nr:hypothetical protein DL93DRAFT_2081771 [Clavulina sp. PMI_390]